jgi:hypothetical protein
MADPVAAAVRKAALAIENRNTPEHGLTWGDCQERAQDAIVAFLGALPLAWVRDNYGADEAVFTVFLREKVEVPDA